MIHGAKHLITLSRTQIENIKANIRESVRPFDGDGRPFDVAVKELRQEGWVIQYSGGACHYLCLGNPSKNIPPNLSPVWKKEVNNEH